MVLRLRPADVEVSVLEKFLDNLDQHWTELRAEFKFEAFQLAEVVFCAVLLFRTVLTTST